MASKIFAEMLAKVDPEDRRFVEKNLAISFQVREILDNHPTINTQKALAEALGKEPSEISKWLSGLHNIGLENITKMETALGRDIILTDEQAKERYAKADKGNFQLFQTVNFAGKTDKSDPASEFLKKKETLVYPYPVIKQPQIDQGGNGISGLAY